MALSKQRAQVRLYNTPLACDVMFYERVDSVLPKNDPRYATRTYGTPHWDSLLYPDHRLCYIRPASRNQDGEEEWYYAARREAQDDYNWEFQGNDTLMRTYVIPREEYPSVEVGVNEEPNVVYAIDLLSADQKFASYVFVGESVVRLGEELDSLFVAVRRIFTKETLVSYRFDDDIERYIRITKQPIEADSYTPDPQTGPLPGVIVEIVPENTWIDFKVTTEVMWKTGELTDGTVMVQLPSVPADVNFRFPPRLDYVGLAWSTASAFHPSAQPAYDEAFYFDFLITEPAPPPYRGTIERWLTNDPTEVTIPATTKPTVRQDSFGVVRSWSSATPRGNSARATAMKVEVPATIHGEIELPSIASPGGGTEEVPALDLGNGGFDKLVLTETPGYTEFAAASTVVASVEVRRAKYNLYEVQIASFDKTDVYPEFDPPT